MSADQSFRLDGNAIRARLCRSVQDSSDSLHVVLLTSPENPTGESWSLEELKSIANCCVERSAVLIVDHCFLLAGVQEVAPSTVWASAPPRLDWIGIWDTGKTIGLNEEKLGFLIASESLQGECRKAIETVQFGVSRRQKMMFARILSDDRFRDYLRLLRDTCLSNLDFLRTELEGDSRFVVRSPKWGSFALIDCNGVGLSDGDIRKYLLEERIGVISGHVFFHDGQAPQSTIRIALARRSDYFRESVRRIVRALTHLQRKR